MLCLNLVREGEGNDMRTLLISKSKTVKLIQIAKSIKDTKAHLMSN